MSVERWWRHGVVVEVEVPAEGAEAALRRTTERLDGMRGLGVDAVLLRWVGEGADGVASGAGNAVDAVDALLVESSRRGLRVMVAVRGDRADLGSAARMWLNRGVAGIEVDGGGEEAVRTVRGAMRGVRGERVLVRGASAGGDGAGTEADAAEMRVVGISGVEEGGAAALRGSVEGVAAGKGGGSGVLVEAGGAGAGEPSLARVSAAVALLGVPGGAMLRESAVGSMEEGGAESAAGKRPDEHTVEAQVRQMAGLHRDRAAFVSGGTTVLDHDAEGLVVWLRRGPGGQVLVVVCNVSSKPVRMSMAGDVARERLRGTFLKTISRSDNELGGMPIERVEVPAGGVYVGELSR